MYVPRKPSFWLFNWFLCTWVLFIVNSVSYICVLFSGLSFSSFSMPSPFFVAAGFCAVQLICCSSFQQSVQFGSPFGPILLLGSAPFISCEIHLFLAIHSVKSLYKPSYLFNLVLPSQHVIHLPGRPFISVYHQCSSSLIFLTENSSQPHQALIFWPTTSVPPSSSSPGNWP